MKAVPKKKVSKSAKKMQDGFVVGVVEKSNDSSDGQKMFFCPMCHATKKRATDTGVHRKMKFYPEGKPQTWATCPLAPSGPRKPRKMPKLDASVLGIPGPAVAAFVKKTEKAVEDAISESNVDPIIALAISATAGAALATAIDGPMVIHHDHENVSRLTRLTKKECKQAGNLIAVRSLFSLITKFMGDPKFVAKLRSGPYEDALTLKDKK